MCKIFIIPLTKSALYVGSYDSQGGDVAALGPTPQSRGLYNLLAIDKHHGRAGVGAAGIRVLLVDHQVGVLAGG